MVVVVETMVVVEMMVVMVNMVVVVKNKMMVAIKIAWCGNLLFGGNLGVLQQKVTKVSFTYSPTLCPRGKQAGIVRLYITIQISVVFEVLCSKTSLRNGLLVIFGEF